MNLDALRIGLPYAVTIETSMVFEAREWGCFHVSGSFARHTVARM